MPPGGSQGNTNSLPVVWNLCRPKGKTRRPKLLDDSRKAAIWSSTIALSLVQVVTPNVVEENPSSLRMPPRQEGQLSGVPMVTFH